MKMQPVSQNTAPHQATNPQSRKSECSRPRHAEINRNSTISRATCVGGCWRRLYSQSQPRCRNIWLLIYMHKRAAHVDVRGVDGEIARGGVSVPHHTTLGFGEPKVSHSSEAFWPSRKVYGLPSSLRIWGGNSGNKENVPAMRCEPHREKCMLGTSGQRRRVNATHR